MSTWLKRTSQNSRPDPTETASELHTAESANPGHYLTDGVHLYRYLGEIPEGIEQMVGLEDCSSLKVTLLPVSELHVHGLHSVERSGEDLAERPPALLGLP